jgi:hypothetical protein
MPTLSKAKTETQLILKWVGISLGVILLILMIVKFVTFIISLATPPAPPEAAFGKLPAISFPIQTEKGLTYSLDTVTGLLPNFPDRTNIYKTVFNPPTLLGLRNTQDKVRKIGFSSSGTSISENIYKWTDHDRNITINIYSSNFTFSSSYLSSKSLQIFSGSDQINSAIDIAKSFLSNMSLFPQDIDKSKTKTTTYSIINESLFPTTKTFDTKIVRVDFFQQDLNSLPIYYDRGMSSTIEFFVGKKNGSLEVVDGRFFHNNISKTSSTYAIKTAKEAYSELQQGKAYIAYRPSNATEIIIKKVSLGYFAGEKNQEFMMPVVEFEGNDNFVAYISAVKDEWINN